MRTVTPPSPQKDYYHLPCHNRECNAVMECEKKELRWVSDQRKGDEYVMTCPHCKHESWYASDAMYPARVGKEALK